MAVDISKGGIKFKADIDDKDFQSASERIKAQLKLIHNESGKNITPPVLEQEKKLRQGVTLEIEKQNIAAKKLHRTIISNSQAEIDAAKMGQIGSIKSGTVVGNHAIGGKLANEATAASVAQETLAVKTKVATSAIKAQSLSIEEMRAKLLTLKEAQLLTTNPIQRERYNKKIQETGVEITRMSNVGKAGFDNLGNAIKGTSNPISKAISGVFRLAYLLPGIGVAGILAFAIDPIIAWVSGLTEAEKTQKKLNEAIQETASLQAKETAETQIYIDKLKDVNVPVEKRQALLDEFILKSPNVLSALNLQNIATADGTKILDNYLVSLKKKIELQQLEKNYTESVQRETDISSGKLSDETDLKGYNKVARTIGDIALFRTKKDTEKYIKEENDKRRKTAEESQKVISEGYRKQIQAVFEGNSKRVSAEDSSLNALEDKLKTNGERLRNLQAGQSAKALQAEKANLEKQIKDRKSILGLDSKEVTKSNEKFAKNYEKNINQAAALQVQVTEMLARYKRKALSPDDEAIQAINDDFKAIANKVKEFNDNPKNKIKVSPDKLEEARKIAVDDLIYNRETDILKVEIEKQKQIFEEYEQYKLDYGADKANERYAAELKGFKSYTDYIQSKLALNMAGTFGKPTGSQQDRTAMLGAASVDSTEADKARQAKTYKEAYDAAKTHTQSLIEIEADYQAKVKALGETASSEQLAILARDRDAKKQAEYAAAIDSDTNWSNMFASFERMSKEGVKKYLDDVQKRVDADLKSGKITVAEHIARTNEIKGAYDKFGGSNVFSRVTTSLKNWKKAIDEFGKGSQEAKSAFKEMAASVAEAAAGAQQIIGDVSRTLDKLGASEGTKQTLESVQGMVGGIGDIAKGLASGNPIDIIKGSVALLTGAIDLFNNKDKKLEKKIAGYHANLKALGESYKQLERDINNSVGESYYTDSSKSVETLKKQQQELQKIVDAERSKKKGDKGKIADLQAQIKDIPNQIADINKAVSDMLVQTSFKDLSNNLADAFSEAFKVGEDAAGRFDDVFNNVIQNAVKNSLKLKLIERPVADFTEALANHMKGNNNSVAGFDFDKWKTILKNAGDNMTASLDGFGQFFQTDLADKSNNANSLQGSIKASLTEDTGSLLAGVFKGVQINTVQLVDIGKQQLNLNRQCFDIAMQNLNTALKIETNTFRTANNTERLATMETSLKSIDTKLSNPGNALAAAGIKP